MIQRRGLEARLQGPRTVILRRRTMGILSNLFGKKKKGKRMSDEDWERLHPGEEQPDDDNDDDGDDGGGDDGD